MVDKQGQRAAKNGKIIESMLFPLFEKNGYTIALCRKDKDYPNYPIYNARTKEEFDSLDKLVLYQVPFHSIYPNRVGRTEFLIINKTKQRRIRVESKWQQGSGSVDEKIPYLYLNAVFAFPENEIVIVMDGGGFDKSAKPWLVEQVKKRWLLDDKPEKSIKVMTVMEFTAWFNKEMGN